MTRLPDTNRLIQYEDEHIIVCIKPHGIATQGKSLRTPDMVTMLKTHLSQITPQKTDSLSGSCSSVRSACHRNTRFCQNTDCRQRAEPPDSSPRIREILSRLTGKYSSPKY